MKKISFKFIWNFLIENNALYSLRNTQDADYGYCFKKQAIHINMLS